MTDQHQLYRWNRARLSDPEAPPGDVVDFERRWIAGYLAAPWPHEAPRDLAGVREQLARMIADEQREMPDSARYVAEQMSRDEFRVLVQEFAVDGLTEAQVFYYVMPRLTLEAQMPMLRILIDEFGSGNLRRAHTTLYVNLLRELAMPSDVASYCELVDPVCLGFVNLFFWLCLRADDPSYFAGAITYLETSIPVFFECYVQACKRLGVAAHAYYSEHQHIDAFHAIEGQNLLRAMQATRTLDPGKAWQGARLASAITADAFEAAVARARQHGAVAAPSRPAASTGPGPEASPGASQ